MDERKVNQSLHVCKKCNDAISYNYKDVKWDESGSGYSAKFIVCPRCGHQNIIKYVEDRALYVNEDNRYFY